MAESNNGSKNWEFVSWICEEPYGYAIMPSTISIEKDELLTAVRMETPRSVNHGRNWIALHRSVNGGNNWSPAEVAVTDTGRSGNPGDLIKLTDGRLVLCYGYRRAPYNICAIVSEDNGQTWSERMILRTGGGCHDIGYTRSVQRADGKIVTVYYWCDGEETERYIAATIWEA